MSNELFNDVNTAGVALRTGLTRDEALHFARWYEERERCETVQYQDAKHGKGVFTVTSMGIIERAASAVLWEGDKK